MIFGAKLSIDFLIYRRILLIKVPKSFVSFFICKIFAAHADRYYYPFPGIAQQSF